MLRLRVPDGRLITARTQATIGLLTLAVAMGSAMASTPQAVEETGTAAGAVVAGPAGGRLVPLTQGGQSRRLPVISPDGTRVAFVQATDKAIALADVVVVALDGRELVRAHVEPVIEGTAYAGMRYAEELRWISPDRLVVRGSINPTTSQYYTIDAATGAIVEDFTDDSSRAAFSPSRRHVVVLAGSPHFVSQVERCPVLLLDGSPIWSPAVGTTLVAGPRFSRDGSALAWIGRSAAGRTTLDIWNGGSLHEVPLPIAADGEVALFWSGSRVLATAAPTGASGKALAWSVASDGTGFARQLPIDPEAGARTLLHTLQAQADAIGIREADFWCASCGLAELPRRSKQ